LGTHSIAVIAIDGSGIPTVSTPVKFRIDTPPEVVISSHSDSARFTAATNLSITAAAKYAYGSVKGVDFYVNGRLIGSAERIGAESFSFTWSNVPEGQYTFKAVAVNEAEVSAASKPVVGSVIK